MTVFVIVPQYQECRIKIVSGPIGCHLSLKKMEKFEYECKTDFSITLLAESSFAAKISIFNI